MSLRRVVVTGLGCISPVGNTVADSWTNLLAGKSGIETVTRFDASNLSCRFAGQVQGFDITQYITEKEARHMDRFIHLGLAAGMQAVQDAGLPTGDALTPEQARTGITNAGYEPSVQRGVNKVGSLDGPGARSGGSEAQAGRKGSDGSCHANACAANSTQHYENDSFKRI